MIVLLMGTGLLLTILTGIFIGGPGALFGCRYRTTYSRWVEVLM